jgi:L-histidine Nalpha-methyltransferase
MVNVSIHSSQFPQTVERELLECLRTRQVRQKFHYLTYKQSEKWLELHRAYAPSRVDADCAAIYDQAFAAAARRIAASRVAVVGLGCGGGQKDARLIRMLAAPQRMVSYVPCDVSLALVLIAREAAANAAPEVFCHPLVCDLAAAPDLPEAVESLTARDAGTGAVSRVISFFGMVPNFEPASILPRLASLMSDQTWLLLSANLAPGPDYDAGMQRILPGYDNALTRDWLLMFLFDLGVEPSDGIVHFGIEEGQENLKRVTADFQFAHSRRLTLNGRTFSFEAGDKIRLFYSYRYTPERIASVLERCGLAVVEQWAAASGEEGVFLCKGR